MFLSKVKYSQYAGHSKNWALGEVEFEKVNLLVGKNSSGKSKTISIIHGLSMILSENVKLAFDDGHFSVTFTNEGNRYDLDLNYENNQVVSEKLLIDNDEKISRRKDGIGHIISKTGQRHEFKIPLNELKVNRRDQIQYPYLEDLNFWARHVRLFQFNTFLGKNALGYRDKKKNTEVDFNLKDTDKLIDIFSRGNAKHKEKFTDKIIADFNFIGYNITNVDLGSLISVGLKVDNPDIEIVGLRIQEKDIECKTDQHDMSMGMYRALSIIIHFNYYELEGIPGCVLIDDIGEGLDYERSMKLIELLIKKVESQQTNIQLIMSTNDKFVMNSVDLKYWQIIDRVGSNVKYYNIKNSAKSFSEFKFTGLNNFDFFATDFFKTGFQTENDVLVQ